MTGQGGDPRARPGVVQVMGWPSRQYGSFERFLVRLAARAGEAGLQSHFVFTEPPASAQFVRDAAAEVHVLAPASALGAAGYLRRVSRLLRATRAGVVHGHHGLDARLALVAARRAGVPRTFYTKHNTPTGARPWLKRRHYRWVARRVDALVAVSEMVQARLLGLGVPAGKVVVCYLGVDTAAYRPDPAVRAQTRADLGLGPADRMVLSTAHFRPWKGVELLPAVAAALGRSVPGAVVLAAGDGPTRPAVEREAARLGVGPDRLRLLGARQDVPALLSAADVFLFPTTSEREGFALALCEALAAGVPVVATRTITDLEHLLGGAAVLVAPGDAAALAAGCAAVLGDASLAADLGRRSRRVAVERLDVDAAARAHVAAYRGVPPLRRG